MILKFNEANSFLVGKDIINNIKDICSELQDEFIEYHLYPNNDIKIKFLGIYLNSDDKTTPKRTKFEICIKNIDKLNKSQVSSLLSVIKQIESYLHSEGIECSYELHYEKRLERIGHRVNIIEYSEFDLNLLSITSKSGTDICIAIIIKFHKK